MLSAAKILICRYRYDPLDRLIGQAPLESPFHQRFYCKSRLATEILGALGFTIIQHDDQLLAQQQREGNAVGTQLLGTDQQRSVLTRLKPDHSPTSTAYSPYGHHPALGAVHGLLAFNGERPEPVTGHYLLGNGYRAFNPVLLRFNSPDNLSPFGIGGLNAYAYCLGDPTNKNDSSGRSPLFRSIIDSLYKNPVNRSLKPPGYRLGIRTYTTPARRSSDPGIKTPSLVEPDFIGLHGTSRKDADKLIKRGVHASYSKTNDRNGFFFTPDKETAYDYADSKQFKKTKEEVLRHKDSGFNNIVEVHIENFSGKTPGKDYDFNHYSYSLPAMDHMNMEFIAKPHISRAIVIRRLGSTSNAKRVRPRAHESPF